MPKETIYLEDVDDGLQIQTRWSKNESKVQIATLQGEAPLKLEDEESPGWWVELNEDQLDEQIKILQRAGRQAFGVRPW